MCQETKAYRYQEGHPSEKFVCMHSDEQVEEV